MKRVKRTAWAIVVSAVIAGLLTLFIAAPGASSNSWARFHITLMLSIMVAVLQPGAAALFVWGFPGFKRRLRIAYGAICIALLLLGLAQVQAAFLTYFGLQTSFWITSGLVVVPYIAPVLLMFFGVRLFAKLLDVKTIWMSFWFVLGIATTAAAAIILIAKQAVVNDVQSLASIGLATWTTIFMVASLLITLRTYRAASPAYRDALRWLAAAAAMVVFAGAGYIGSFMLLGSNNALADYGSAVAPHVIAGLFYIRAAYYFKLINQEQEPVASPQQISLVDIIVFEASLVSSLAQINPLLDPMRLITATNGTQAPSTQQQTTLYEVYAAIEHFLVEKEPIRQFTTDSLRQRIARNFGLGYEDLAKIIGAPSPTIELKK